MDVPTGEESGAPLDTPSVARMYDYRLGGFHHFAVDRQVAEELVALYPTLPLVARANRAALRRVVTVDVTANQRQLKQLLADGRVYTTDVTQSVAIGRARAKAVTNAAMSKANVASLPTKSRLAAPLYWYMEDMGIAPQ